MTPIARSAACSSFASIVPDLSASKRSKVSRSRCGAASRIAFISASASCRAIRSDAISANSIRSSDLLPSPYLTIASRTCSRSPGTPSFSRTRRSSFGSSLPERSVSKSLNAFSIADAGTFGFSLCCHAITSSTSSQNSSNVSPGALRTTPPRPTPPRAWSIVITSWWSPTPRATSAAMTARPRSCARWSQSAPSVGPVTPAATWW